MRWIARISAATTLACAAACTPAARAPSGAYADGSALSESERRAAARVTAAEISGHIRFVADDLLEGRAPGTRGSELAIKYIAAQLESIGLSPGAPVERAGGAPSFFQSVPLVEIRAAVPSSASFRAGASGGASLSLATTGGSASELILWADGPARAKIDDAELVFAGYGITAPEYGWDDYEGVDVRGKVVVLLNFNPPFAGENVRLWYGRWDYKYLTAARHGAVAALIVHTTPSAGYPWQVLASSATGVRYDLPSDGEPAMQARGWITETAAKRLFALAGGRYDALYAAATAKGAKAFRPTPIGVRWSLDMPVQVKTVPSSNVIGLLRGTDPTLRDEAVVYTAHHDHLGQVDRGERTADAHADTIYNGALDNASGVAAVLAIARAAAASPPRRSMLFAFVTAEEQGLLGSRWFARHPTFPAGRLAADVNIDSFNRWGRTRDLGVLGLGKSSVDAVVRAVAAGQGRVVHGDAFPDRGSFYRSDQFELARVGVPAVAVSGGPDHVGRPAGWGKEQRDDFTSKHYHQPSDEYRGDWDLSGAVEDAQLQLVVGLRVANADAMPAWTPGDEFEAARKAAAR